MLWPTTLLLVPPLGLGKGGDFEGCAGEGTTTPAEVYDGFEGGTDKNRPRGFGAGDPPASPRSP